MLNGWMGDRVRVSITGAFGVPGKNENGRIVEFYAERRLCWGSTYFEHKSLQKGVKGPRWSEGNEHENLVLLKKAMLRYV